jgi:TonB family protein
VPAAIPDLFLGQPLGVAARYAQPGHATAVVHARRAGQPITFQVPVSLPARDEARPAVGSVWARARIAELSRRLLHARDEGGEAPALREQITAIALEHHLMSPYTAFVAVDTTRVTEGGRGTEVAVPVEVPEGVRRPNITGGGSGIGGLGLVGYGSGAGGGGSSAIGSGYGAGYGASYGFLSARRARVPDVIPGVVSVRGSLDKEIIRRIFQRHRNEIRYCYEQQLQKNHTLEGRMVLELTIEDSGRVTGSRIVESAIANDAELGACVTQAGRRWEFPKTLGASLVVVRYPYLFRSTDGSPSEEKKP